MGVGTLRRHWKVKGGVEETPRTAWDGWIQWPWFQGANGGIKMKKTMKLGAIAAISTSLNGSFSLVVKLCMKLLLDLCLKSGFRCIFDLHETQRIGPQVMAQWYCSYLVPQRSQVSNPLVSRCKSFCVSSTLEPDLGEGYCQQLVNWVYCCVFPKKGRKEES